MNRTATYSLRTITAVLCSLLLFSVPAYAGISSPSEFTANVTKLTTENVTNPNSQLIEPSPVAQMEQTEDSAPVSPDQFGPGVVKKTSVEEPKETLTYLGVFRTTGYCNCSQCSSGHNLTASGTVPRSNHTIAADPSRFSFGTKLSINGVVYTVEDIGVYGNTVDIYYDNHSDAWGHGLQSAEVYLVQ